MLAGILADIYWEGQDAQKAGSLTKNNETDTDVNQKAGSKANVEAGSDNKKS
ncbi:hypothetical protein D3C76_1662580 [compost metagenome]